MPRPSSRKEPFPTKSQTLRTRDSMSQYMPKTRLPAAVRHAVDGYYGRRMIECQLRCGKSLGAAKATSCINRVRHLYERAGSGKLRAWRRCSIGLPTQSALCSMTSVRSGIKRFTPAMLIDLESGVLGRHDNGTCPRDVGFTFLRSIQYRDRDSGNLKSGLLVISLCRQDCT